MGIRYERDGPLTRTVGQFRGFISAPRDVRVRGAELDALIARQRDRFAARGEAVEWKIRGHDLPSDLTDRLRAAGFTAEAEETVLIGRAKDMASPPVLPADVVLRQVTERADMHRIAALESTIWGQDLSMIGDDLAGRVAAAPDDLVVLVAEADGEVVSAAWLVFRTGTEFMRPVGRLDALRLARTRHLPRSGRRPRPHRSSSRSQLSASGRVQRQRTDPACGWASTQ